MTDWHIWVCGGDFHVEDARLIATGRTEDSRTTNITSSDQRPARIPMAERRKGHPQDRRIRPQAISTPRSQRATGFDRRGRKSGTEQVAVSSDSGKIRPGQGDAMEAKEGMHQDLKWTVQDTNQEQADNLQSSGMETVIMTSLYAIVGAVALERGGEVANKLVQDKILTPLGFQFSPDS